MKKNIYKYSVFCGSLVLVSCNDSNSSTGEESQTQAPKENKKETKEAASEKEKKAAAAKEKEEKEKKIKELKEKAYELSKKNVTEYIKSNLSQEVTVEFRQKGDSVVIELKNLTTADEQKKADKIITEEIKQYINEFYKCNDEFCKKFVEVSKNESCKDTDEIVVVTKQILELKDELKKLSN